MCNAGPRPSFGCISHSFAGPATSPPHFRHLTNRIHLVGGCGSRTLDMEMEQVGWSGHLGLVGGVAIFGCVPSPCPTTLTAMDGGYTFDGILMFHLWYINIPRYQK